MNKILLLILMLLGSMNNTVAQITHKKWGEDSVKCAQNLYIYYELVRAKNYSDAYKAWLYVFQNCPACSKNNFIFGPPIVESQIRKSNNYQRRNELIKLLMEIYDQRLVYFPEKYAYVYERKALDMQEHWPEKVEMYFAVYEKALDLDRVHSAAFYNGYFIAVAELFNKDALTCGQVGEAYHTAMEGIKVNTDELIRQVQHYQEKEAIGALDNNDQSKMARAVTELKRYDDVISNIRKIAEPLPAECFSDDIVSENSANDNNAKSSGTGFAISSDGFITTNYHLVAGASIIKVKGVGGDFIRSYNAVVIAEDKNNDIAIIKINDKDFTSLGTIPYTINSNIQDAGSSVYALGYPLRATMGDEVKLTNGIVSSKTGFQSDITTYQISVPVQPGNSGGPLFNSKGEIVGIINAKHIGAENASYAIKTNYLMNLIQSMDVSPSLPINNTISSKGFSEQVKLVKEFVYILEINP